MSVSALEVIGEHGIEEKLIYQQFQTGKNATTLKPVGKRTSINKGLDGRRESNQSENEKSELMGSKFSVKANHLNNDSAEGLVHNVDIENLGIKKSCLSPTLLSNYVLAISLLKNISMKFAYPDNFARNFE